MKVETPKTIYLKDYQPAHYSISKVDLVFDLGFKNTNVKSTMEVSRAKGVDSSSALILSGEDMQLLGIKVNGEIIQADMFNLTEKTLTIHDLPENFILEIENTISPKDNTILEGLYVSGNILCTQNEPEGFRRITYFLDRPDNMAIYSTKMIADKSEFPLLLSNGNPTNRGELDDGKHFVTWEDPHPKPSYLYALVAGDLGMIKDTFTTKSGREVALEIYCDKGNESKCSHAIESLKKAMKWDEKRFSLEYDLDIYMIVAVDSFNMGAMENKGLNIFNSSLVLAKPETATDKDFLAIESVVGHEYFHNWTGNRVTCRDWFQLTLKEGLTVFRDQEFSSDLNSRSVKRIEDIKILRSHQFSEDAGPMAHPIKPSSYIEINNFYTPTIYDKGAEIIRMIQTLLGVDGFRKGIDKYFELFDGQAVTTEDFLHAMSAANNNFDFGHFEKWYAQAGTPRLKFQGDYNEKSKTFTLNLNQNTQNTPGQNVKEALLLPLEFGLVGESGEDLSYTCNDSRVIDNKILFNKEQDSFVFENVSSKPIVSMNRSFSAPIINESEYTEDDLAFLMANDQDGFNRYESGQQLFHLELDKVKNSICESSQIKVSKVLLEAVRKVVQDDKLDHSIKAYTLSLPEEGSLLQKQNILDFSNTHKAREVLTKEIGETFFEDFHRIYTSLEDQGEYSLSPNAVGKRVLRQKLLNYMVSTGKDDASELAYEQFKKSKNMTEKFGALSILAYYSGHYTEKALDEFYAQWKGDTLVMQKWLSAQSICPLDKTFNQISNLEENSIFDVKVPNLVRALYGPFVMMNYIQFHHPTGRSYELLADRLIKFDQINPTITARLSSAFKDYSRLPEDLKGLMKVQLEKIIAVDRLSKNTFEVIQKTLGQ